MLEQVSWLVDRLHPTEKTWPALEIWWLVPTLLEASRSQENSLGSPKWLVEWPVAHSPQAETKKMQCQRLAEVRRYPDR